MIKPNFAVGDGALEANIRKVFDIEGAEDLATGTFSADAVEVNAAAAEGGKVKFTVTPSGGLGTSRAGPPMRTKVNRQNRFGDFRLPTSDA